MRKNTESVDLGFSRERFFLLAIAFFLFSPTGLLPGGFQGAVIGSAALFFVSFICGGGRGSSVAFIGLVFLSMVSLVSVIYNSGHFVVSDAFYPFRFLYYLIVFSAAYSNSKYLRLESFCGLLLVFIVVQFVVVLLQKSGMSLGILNFFWDTEKNWAQRSTGTFSNPNTMAIVVLFAFVTYSFLSKVGPRIKLILSVVVALTIYLSGSRTAMVLAVGLIFFNAVAFLELRRLFRLVFFVTPLALLLGGGFHYYIGSGYVAQLFDFLATGDISEIPSVVHRFNTWLSIIQLIDRFTFINGLIGLGPGKEIGLRFTDNEYLRLFFTMGGIGLFYIFFLGGLVYYLSVVRRRSVEVFFIYKATLSIFAALVISGIVLTSFTSWLYPVLLYLLLGVGWGKVEDAREKNRDRGASTSMG